MVLAVDSAIEGTKQVIKLKGFLDFSTVDSFQIENQKGIAIKEFEVDFSQLEFIDSTGIGAILTILHTASSLGATVEFVGMTDKMIDLFKTIGVFEIKKSILPKESL